MLTRAGFELAPSGYQPAALPVELASPQGSEASFFFSIQLKRTRYFCDNLTLIHERKCSVSILFQNHLRRYRNKNFSCLLHLSWIKNSPPLPVDLIAQQVKRWTDISRSEFKSRSCQHFSIDFSSVRLSRKISVHVLLRMILKLYVSILHV